jgi:hypothetical protein
MLPNWSPDAEKSSSTLGAKALEWSRPEGNLRPQRRHEPDPPGCARRHHALRTVVTRRQEDRHVDAARLRKRRPGLRARRPRTGGATRNRHRRGLGSPTVARPVGGDQRVVARKRTRTASLSCAAKRVSQAYSGRGSSRKGRATAPCRGRRHTVPPGDVRGRDRAPQNAEARSVPLCTGVYAVHGRGRLDDCRHPPACRGRGRLGVHRGGERGAARDDPSREGPAALGALHFAIPPQQGRLLTAQWLTPSGRPAAPPVGKPRASTVVSFVKGSRLQPGLWRCVLRAGGRVVARASLRLSG